VDSPDTVAAVIKANLGKEIQIVVERNGQDWRPSR
jgi:hypothetical protein